jgi:hypothetical protein
MTIAKNTFQFRFDGGKWQDIELQASGLRLIAAAVTSTVGARHPSVAFPELYEMIVRNHNATVDQDASIKAIEAMKFEVISNHDDVLKVGYEFTIRTGTRDETEIAVKARNLYNRRSEAKRREIQLYPQHEPRQVKGGFTVMPGN